MTKYTIPPTTFSTVTQTHTFPQTFPIASFATLYTLSYSDYSDTQLIKAKTLRASRDPATAGDWQFRIQAQSTNTTVLGLSFTGLTVNIVHAGFTSTNVTLSANSITNVYPGVTIITNGSKVTSFELTDFNIINTCLFQFAQTTASANFWVDIANEYIRTRNA
jgi:hypothetical protein